MRRTGPYSLRNFKRVISQLALNNPTGPVTAENRMECLKRLGSVDMVQARSESSPGNALMFEQTRMTTTTLHRKKTKRISIILTEPIDFRSFTDWCCQFTRSHIQANFTCCADRTSQSFDESTLA